MKIYSWNINGIRSAQKSGFLDEFIKKENPDILCLQETRASGAREVFLEQYEKYWNDGEKKGYSGTAIFSKVKPLSTRNDLPEDVAEKFGIAKDEYGNPNNEGRVITAEFEDFFLVNVYVPNAKDDLSRIPLRYKVWDPAFLFYIKRLEKDKPVIVVGDMNVAHTEDDLARPGPNEGKKGFTKEERDGFQKFIDSGFLDTFRIFTNGNGHYTWWAHWANARERNVGWRIDYILASPSLRERVVDARIHSEILGSDHCPVSIELKN